MSKPYIVVGKSNIKSKDIVDINDQVKMAYSESLAFISHEFKNPLTVMISTIEMLLDGEIGELNPDQRELLLSNKNYTEHLMRLVSDLLDQSILNVNDEQLKRSTFHLDVFINDIILNFQAKCKEKQIVIDKNIAIKQASINGDQDRLFQAFVNILSNAIKYTPQHGVITVTVSSNASYYTIEISDTGPGIKPEIIHTIFDKYKGEKDKEGGAGIGLYIAQHIIKQHQGLINVHSVLNRGTSFIIQLPKPKT